MCVWTPEMFELSKGPERYLAEYNTIQAGKQRVQVFEGAITAFQEVQTLEHFSDTKIAVASATQHRSWAETCLSMFELPSGAKLADMVEFSAIYPKRKTKHFAQLQKESGIPYNQMLFFDDCTYGDNCGVVERGCPGVVTVRTPEGMTNENWRTGLAKFAAAQAALEKP
ncbi:unnamed protein product [Chrysoparadoxa australica]